MVDAPVCRRLSFSDFCLAMPSEPFRRHFCSCPVRGFFVEFCYE
ncbi:hypothetical protein predicted by Glimmer/Critica [Neisseria meningitidis WUE 2594]|uniref:Uncharacterized protein n=1 Tax=Neisseria meningitidis serogroup B (strain ATCC 13091 / M2091) TaxID=862513 RepID=E0N6D5_NEIM3|nr:hypothetical protein HMPREF0602_0065 [Neisseria meningitidis ATCC 13091]KER38576.1 hypothetical protein F528_2484 [Neisseria meningitidis 992008]CBY91572.1 hypothetical protein predicted by Glimmer/Critica [Neisseria meningitidis WUE 2594]